MNGKYVRLVKRGKWHATNDNGNRTLCNLRTSDAYQVADTKPDDGVRMCCDCKRFVLAVLGNFWMLARSHAKKVMGL